MRCPFCSHDDTQVVETRASDDGDVIRRRRRCPSCDRRFTTYERADLQFPAVVKKNGSRTDYQREKLRGSFMLALRKRPVRVEDVDRAVEHIESTLLSCGEREVESAWLGDLVMRELKKLDKVAYVRFASVYRSFEHVGDFQDVIDEVKPKAKPSKPTARPANRAKPAKSKNGSIPFVRKP